MENIQIRQCSSLEKVFANEPKELSPCSGASVLQGEEFAYQLVLRGGGWGNQEIAWSLSSPLQDCIQVYRVENVPCELAAYPAEDAHDENYITLSPGLFPDILRPLETDPLEISAFLNTTLWINISVPEDCPGGEYPVRFSAKGNGTEAEALFTLKVIPACLPRQKLLYTQWFHVDCLAEWYHVPVYSERHWDLIEAYLKEAGKGGMNTVLTPVLTPPLDTAVGTERLCVQLTEIEKQGDSYRFDFTKLRRFAELALRCGITHFEINQLFTQWGAKFTPAVYAVESGERKRIFGWDTAADSPEYTAFLRQLLPALIAFFEELGLRDRLLFHVSDEPAKSALEQYEKVRSMIGEYIGELPVIDALSDPEFYDRGLVQHPVAATNHIAPFLERSISGLWAYTCCGQNYKVGNRFLSMPSCRNRILGLQLYKFHIQGFLHWGYNFWHSQESKRMIDPFRVTDGGRAFPGGDAFSVYPGEDGRPISSLRMKVFTHGLQDLRALELLETLTDRETVEKLVPGYSDITFSEYPHSPAFLLELREKVNARIEEAISALPDPSLR